MSDLLPPESNENDVDGVEEEMSEKDGVEEEIGKEMEVNDGEVEEIKTLRSILRHPTKGDEKNDVDGVEEEKSEKVGVEEVIRSILRNKGDELSAINKKKRVTWKQRITWKDEKYKKYKTALFTLYEYEDEEERGERVEEEEGGGKESEQKDEDEEKDVDGVEGASEKEVEDDGVAEVREIEMQQFECSLDMDNHINDLNEAIHADEANRDDEKTEEVKKKRGGNGGRRTKKKSNERPQTEEEVMADIGRKIVDAGEKATRRKQLKTEEAERRKEKKNDAKRKRDEKKKKKEEMEIENQKKEVEKRKKMESKPKSRAEAARRTKALLAMGSKEVARESPNEEEEDEPKRKKRKYTKRTKPVPFIRGVKDVNEEESNVGCGKYIDNPNDVTVQTVCMGKSLEEEESDGVVDDILSVPIWGNNEKEESTEQLQSHSLHPHEHMKRHVAEVQELSDAVIHEYREMVHKLEGMNLNLFADSTIRRFDTRVIRNMDMLSATGMWPDAILPQPDRLIPKCQYQMWNTPFKKYVRILPSHKQKDNLTSREIDLMSGGAAEKVTKRDIKKNLNDLIISKLKKTSWTPLPNAGNPFDVPEITTRIKPRKPEEYQSASHVHKMSLVNMPCEFMNKKRKRTRKEALLEIANTKPTVEENESIYKEEERVGEVEEDGYHYAWDEMGELMENPMRDDRFLEDALGHPYVGPLGMDVDGDVVMMDNSHYDHEETQFGEAFSFMAAHM